MDDLQALVLANIKEPEKEKLKNTFKNIHFTFIKSKDVTQQDIDTADIIIGNPGRILCINNEKLKMLQLNSAGSDYYVQENVLHTNTKLANASGSYGKAIAEHTIGMIVALNKNFKSYFKNMENGIWEEKSGGKEIYHSTIAIVGLGDLGYQLAKRLKAFDTHIIGIKRTAASLPKYIDEIYTMDALDSVLPRADYVILCLPHSEETIHCINSQRLLTMKKDAVLVNIGRGSAINSNDLVEVLKQDHLYGVALDVTEPEPLPSNHPLWAFDNVFITPHASGGFEWPSVRNYFMDLTIANIHHLLNNEELENSVDFTTGYRKTNTALKD